MHPQIAPTGITCDFLHSEMWFEGQVLCCRLKPRLSLDLKMARMLVKDRIEFGKGRKCPLLFDISALYEMDVAATGYLYSNPAHRLISRQAILADNNVIRMLARASVYMYRPKLEIIVTQHRQQALDWLVASGS